VPFVVVELAGAVAVAMQRVHQPRERWKAQEGDHEDAHESMHEATEDDCSVGNGEWGMGNGEWGMGNGEGGRGIGNAEC